MNIRIDGNDASQLNAVNSKDATGRVETTPAGAGAAASAVEIGDSAEISGITDLVGQAMVQPEVRMDKVEAIKAQIEAGTYEVDPAKVADAMIDALMKNGN